MVESTMTLRDLLERLRERDLVEPDQVGDVEEFLVAREAKGTLPLAIRFLQGVGAWIAAYCFIAFLLMMKWIASFEGAGFLSWGVVFLLVGELLRRSSEGIFRRQFSLALVVAGHSLFLLGVGEIADALFPVVLAATLLAALLHFVYPDPTHRFGSAVGVIFLWVTWLAVKDHHLFLHAVVLVQMIGLLLLFTGRRVSADLLPLSYALAGGLAGTLVLVTMYDMDIQTPAWPSTALLSAGLLWSIVRAARDRNLRGGEPFWIAIIAALALAGVSNPGILVALLLLVLGHWMDDRILRAMGITSLAFFLVVFYYDLQMDYLSKSLVLAGSGAVLLVLRAFLLRRGWAS